MKLRRRFKQISPLEERLAEQAKRLIEEAEQMPPGPKRDEALRKARQMNTATHLSEWLTSPGLRSPD